MAMLVVPSAASGVDAQESFEATYAVYRKGIRIARMTRTLSESKAGNFLFASDTRAAGLFALFRKDQIIEQSEWKVSGGSMRPLRYRYEHSGGNRNRDVSVSFNWEKGRVINSVNGSSWEMPASRDILDKLLYQLAIMYDLRTGKDSLDYTVADGGKTKQYTFERIGEETIEIPLGTFETVKLLRYKSSSRRTSTLWCAKELDYLPIRVENVEKDGGLTVVVLDSLSGLALVNAAAPPRNGCVDC